MSNSKFNKNFTSSQRSKQLIDFNGLRRETNNPKDKSPIGFTDMDFYMNYRTKFFIFGETKVVGKNFNLGYDGNGNLVKSDGNRLRWETLCNSINILSMMVLTSHDTDPNDPILLEETIVEHVYVSPNGQNTGSWTRLGNMTLGQFWDSLLEKQGIKDKTTKLQEILNRNGKK